MKKRMATKMDHFYFHVLFYGFADNARMRPLLIQKVLQRFQFGCVDGDFIEVVKTGVQLQDFCIASREQ